MALERRALLLAFVAVCALLLAVGLVAPQQSALGSSAAAGLSASVAKQTSPLVLTATEADRY